MIFYLKDFVKNCFKHMCFYNNFSLFSSAKPDVSAGKSLGSLDVWKPSLLCIQSSSCDLCRELLQGVAYTIYVGTQSELHCMVMSKMCHMW